LQAPRLRLSGPSAARTHGRTRTRGLSGEHRDRCPQRGPGGRVSAAAKHRTWGAEGGEGILRPALLQIGKAQVVITLKCRSYRTGASRRNAVSVCGRGLRRTAPAKYSGRKRQQERRSGYWPKSSSAHLEQESLAVAREMWRCGSRYPAFATTAMPRPPSRAGADAEGLAQTICVTFVRQDTCRRLARRRAGLSARYDAVRPARAGIPGTRRRAGSP